MSEQQARRLHKGEHHLIGGVCSGLADYFGVDPWVVRIVFIVLALAPPGVGFLLYLLLWLLIPERPNTEPTLGESVRSGANSMASDVRRIASDFGIRKRQAQ